MRGVEVEREGRNFTGMSGGEIFGVGSAGPGRGHGGRVVQ